MYIRCTCTCGCSTEVYVINKRAERRCYWCHNGKHNTYKMQKGK